MLLLYRTIVGGDRAEPGIVPLCKPPKPPAWTAGGSVGLYLGPYGGPTEGGAVSHERSTPVGCSRHADLPQSFRVQPFGQTRTFPDGVVGFAPHTQLVCKAHKLLYHSTLGSRVIKKRKKAPPHANLRIAGRQVVVFDHATSLYTRELNAIQRHKCFLCSPFYERACRGAMLG